MRIVHYLARMRLEDGGVVRAVLDLCTALAGRGHDVWLMTFDAADVPPDWARDGGGDDGAAGARGPGAGGRPRVLALVRRAGPVPRAARASSARAAQLIAGAGAVHLHVPWDPVCAQLARVAARARVPYVVGIHGMLDDWSMAQKGLKKRLYLSLGGRRFLERAGAVHVTAEAERDQSARWYPRGRPVVLPLIFDARLYRSLPGPGPARKRFGDALGRADEAKVLFLSRLHPKKRVDLLLEAAALLRRDGVAVRVLVAGTGEEAYERGLRRLVEERGLGGSVSFLGFVSGTEKVSLYQSADLFVLPTSQENWGFVLIEALASGTPAVTTRGVDIWSELERSGGTVVVDQTPEAFRAAIAALLPDPARRRAMGERGRAWVLEALDADRVAARYEAMYEGLEARA